MEIWYFSEDNDSSEWYHDYEHTLHFLMPEASQATTIGVDGIEQPSFYAGYLRKVGEFVEEILE